MKLDDAHCYRALSARDHRFDGAFFVGVTTTGIYCRPICPARTPRASRCRFFASAAAAERRGFRPCLRCRPELAPPADAVARGNEGSRARSGVAAPRAAAGVTASVDIVRARAVEAGERIAAGALDDGALDELAAELGVSARHVRRVVEREFGASPVALAQTRRLLTAKQLLTDSSLPLSAVALASGFGSVRRFNALFRERYRLAPGDLRSAGKAAAGVGALGGAGTLCAIPTDPDSVRVALVPRQPFDWPSMCAYLSARAIPGVEHVDSRYHRVMQIASRSSPTVMHSGIVSIGTEGRSGRLVADISFSLLPVLVPVLARLRRLLDLDASPQVIASHLADDALLARSVAERPGQRVPGAAHAFELAVRAVLGQQVSVRGATTLAGRLVQAVYEPLATANASTTMAGHVSSRGSSDGVEHESSLTHLPISAARLADAPIALIAGTGLPLARAMCLQRMARAVADGEVQALDDAFTGTIDLRAFEETFTALPGIGPWTAQYVAMRALRAPDAFPASDLALRKAAGGMSAAKLQARAESWRPWRAYAAMHLWASLS